MSLIKIRSLLLVSLLILSVNMGCGKKEAGEIKGKLTFTAGEVMVNGKGAKTGAVLAGEDILKTGENSLAVLHFSELAVITVRSNAEIKVLSLIDRKKSGSSLDLYQSKGSTFNKVVKKGIHYNVKTPTAIAGIRGTVFDVTVAEGKGRFRLLKGKIKIAPVKKGKVQEEKSIELTRGNSVTVTEEKIGKPVKIPAKEVKVLEQFDRVALVPDLEKTEKTALPVKEAVKKELLKIEIEKRDTPVKEKETRKTGMTLGDLKKRYGNLSVVKTKRGKTYIGSFKQVGDKVEVMTTGGKVILDSKNIEKVTRYRE